MSLQGKVVLLVWSWMSQYRVAKPMLIQCTQTGASMGIGEACATALAAEGATLVLVSRTEVKPETILDSQSLTSTTSLTATRPSWLLYKRNCRLQMLTVRSSTRWPTWATTMPSMPLLLQPSRNSAGLTSSSTTFVTHTLPLRRGKCKADTDSRLASRSMLQLLSGSSPSPPSTP